MEWGQQEGRMRSGRMRPQAAGGLREQGGQGALTAAQCWGSSSFLIESWPQGVNFICFLKALELLKTSGFKCAVPWVSCKVLLFLFAWHVVSLLQHCAQQIISTVLVTVACKLLFNSLLKDAKMRNYFHELKLVKKQSKGLQAALVSISAVNGGRYCVKCFPAVPSFSLKNGRRLSFVHTSESPFSWKENSGLCVYSRHLNAFWSHSSCCLMTIKLWPKEINI